MTAAMDWSKFAGCRDSDPEMWFGPENETAPAKVRREELANAVCAGCIVRTACLRYAVTRPELHGTWAGRNEEELAAERVRRARKEIAA
jgi:WhiB family redox-sensing transcriptional regulator